MTHGEEDSAADEDRISRCDYCRLPIPKAPVEGEFRGDTYSFCSVACREAQAEADRVFTEYHGTRRFRTGISVLDGSLPEGIPRNSFVMLTDLAGTRSEAIQTEFVWRALQRGEPAVLVSFLEPPVSTIQQFASLEWNVLPYLEDDQLRIVDCFTYRVDDRERMFDRMNAWNAHLSGVADDATIRVRDPSDTRELSSRVDDALEDLAMHDEGIVVLDSLTELGTLVQPVQAYNFVKDLRADVCKGRFVPIFAGATVTTNDATFPHDLKYMVDGVIEMQLSEEIVEDALVKRIRIRKMSGVLTYPEWNVYEYAPGRGIVTFDPIEQMAESEAAADRSPETPSPARADGERSDGHAAADGAATGMDGEDPTGAAESDEAETGGGTDDRSPADEEQSAGGE